MVADYSSFWHDTVLDARYAPFPSFAGTRPGAISLPATTLPGIGAQFAGEGSGGGIYVINMSRSNARLFPVIGGGFGLELEYSLLNHVDPADVFFVLDKSKVKGLIIDKMGGTNLFPWPSNK
jgi:hypothetical protein